MNSKNFKNLYKMDSKGKIRQWHIAVHDSKDGPYYCQTHGLMDGKQQVTSTFVKEGKNIGKSNETTPMEQCLLEAESLWKKQKERKGYSETIPTEKPKMPMLAKKYKDDGHKIVWPAYCQPKLDGIRCIMTVGLDGSVTFKSRQNKEFTSLGHIKDSLSGWDIQRLLGRVFDGELYNHDLHDDFQSLVSAIKRDKPSDQTHLIQYHVYDSCSDRDFKDRINFLDDLKKLNNPYIKVVPTYKVDTADDFSEKYKEFLSDGYEGAMLRNAVGPYEYNRRSPNLQKHKDFIDEEFEIVGAYQNKGKMQDECTFECITDEGAVFGVKPKGSSEQRRQMWYDYQDGKLLGKIMTVRFFEWTNSDPPVPRFPIGITIRDYE